MKNIKTLLADGFLSFAYMYGSAWIAFLISMIPMYIFRGTYHNSTNKELYENLLRMSIGLIVSSVSLILRYRSGDSVGKKTAKEAFFSALIGGGFYWLLWVICGGIYVIAVDGYCLAVLIGKHSNGNPTALGATISATVFCSVYVGAVLLGSYFARKKRNTRS
jgi:formate-dependent nitrite reductase membrane component NrfD